MQKNSHIQICRICDSKVALNGDLKRNITSIKSRKNSMNMKITFEQYLYLENFLEIISYFYKMIKHKVELK